MVETPIDTALDAEPAAAKPPIVMVDSTTATATEQIVVAGRAIVTAVAAFGPFLAVLKTEDLIAILNFFRGAEWPALVSAIVAVATIGVTLWRTYVKRRIRAVALKAAPDDVGIVKTSTPA